MSTKNKTVFITGANKGIGFETAKQLAQKGYYVYMGSRDKFNGLRALQELRSLGITNIDLIEIDVANVDSVASARKELESRIQQLDLLINNAGIAGQQPQNMVSGDMENLRNVFDTNFFGAVQTTQQLLPLLKKSGEPRIINVTSGLASLTFQSSEDYNNPNAALYDAYTCSKIALNAFTVLLARELRGSNFKINCIAPGYTATALNGFKGAQTPKQAAAIIVKYATEEDCPTGKYLNKEGETAW